jgi:hypothetical protein
MVITSISQESDRIPEIFFTATMSNGSGREIHDYCCNCHCPISNDTKTEKYVSMLDKFLAWTLVFIG